MANITGMLISKEHQWKIRLALWAALFFVTLSVMACLGAYQVSETLLTHTTSSLEQFKRLKGNVVGTFDALKADVTAEPCTADFYDELRRVAFLPDGLNEFIYAPDGIVQCSLTAERLPKPFDLGKPDLVIDSSFVTKLWLNRDLGFLGLSGLTGTIAAQGALATIIPQQPPTQPAPPWISSESVIVATDGRWWHQTGDAGIYSRRREVSSFIGPWQLNENAFYQIGCDSAGIYCIATQATIADLFTFGSLTIVFAITFAAVLSLWLASRIYGAMLRYFAFDARFRRNLNSRTIICHYQPIMNLRTGAIVGCEVLVRWRDLNGSVVFPDQFLAIVEKHDLTMELTKLVVERAQIELAACIPPGRTLQVNFNVFPQDFEAKQLIEVFRVFDKHPHSVDLAVEIVESDDLAIEAAQRSIEALSRAGIRTYLDDFGTGYSSIHHLAALSLEGVKLDRAFAMATDGTLMAQMLPHALEMMQRAKRLTVVEGVETEERLKALRATGLVDFVQGYFIARPLDIERFAQFLIQNERTAQPAKYSAAG